MPALKLTLRTPPDYWEAHLEWKSNCGPTALAALLAMDVQPIRPAFPHFPGKAYTSLDHMHSALRHFGFQYSSRFGINAKWPRFGLVFVTWPTAPSGGRKSKRMERALYHWIAAIGDYVFDPILMVWHHREVWEPTVFAKLREEYKTLQPVNRKGTVEVFPARQICKKTPEQKKE